MKHAKAPETGGGTKRFSLVPARAQQQMYKALAALKPSKSKLDSASGAEVAEIAICLAMDEKDPVILACTARGARAVRKGCKLVGDKLAEAHGGRLAAATVAAVTALLDDARPIDTRAVALVCAGQIDGAPETRADYGRAFSFAARHKLPILYLVANHLPQRGKQKPDLRTLYSEFGIPVFSLDANDAIAAYRVATEALHNARHLRGPCVIEALTLQAKAHGKSSGAAAPLDLLREYMERHGSWPF